MGNPEYLNLIGDSPLRIIKMAYNKGFLKRGKNIRNYSAASLYIALRFFKAPFLLDDIARSLNINLFYKLARCYRNLAEFLNKELNLK